MNLRLGLIKMKVLKYTFILLCYLFFKNSFAQSVVSSTGDELINSEYQLSFTMGETAIKTLEKEDKILTQGFHQTRLTITSIEYFSDKDLKINLFPNPATDYLNLFIDTKNIDNSFYIIYNLNGEKLKHNKILNFETQISFEEYAPSVYFVKIFINNNYTNAYKIIKH